MRLVLLGTFRRLGWLKGRMTGKEKERKGKEAAGIGRTR
jgi:hypothetical protein